MVDLMSLDPSNNCGIDSIFDQVPFKATAGVIFQLVWMEGFAYSVLRWPKESAGSRFGASRDPLSTKTEVLLADEAPIFEMEELRGLIAEGQEKGLLTFEQITTCLEEVEVTKEQVGELHSYLLDQGIPAGTVLLPATHGHDGAPVDHFAAPDNQEQGSDGREDPDLEVHGSTCCHEVASALAHSPK